MKLSKSQLENVSETLKDFRVLTQRYKEVKDDPFLLPKFYSRNRNPLFDVTQNSFFRTGLISESAANEKKCVDDHFIQRSRALRFIFQELEKNPNISLKEFVQLLKKYCSTVKLTKEEHNKVTQFAKKNPDLLNYEIYPICGVKVAGLGEYIIR